MSLFTSIPCWSASSTALEGVVWDTSEGTLASRRGLWRESLRRRSSNSESWIQGAVLEINGSWLQFSLHGQGRHSYYA